MLCDSNDFEPYVAYSRLARDKKHGITAHSIQNFLKENSISVTLFKCQNLISHYDSDHTGKLNYMEFMEIVLPKEHPDLRAFVTQRECFDISDDEYLSLDTEVALAVLFDLEIGIFEDLYQEKRRLDELDLTGNIVVSIIENRIQDRNNPNLNINFTNLRSFLNDCGLLPYDSEMISFLRRVDRDDDGVINTREFENFIHKFKPSEDPHLLNNRESRYTRSREKLRVVSPNRKVVQGSQVSLISSNYKGSRKKLPSLDSSLKKEKENIRRVSNVNSRKLRREEPIRSMNFSGLDEEEIRIDRKNEVHILRNSKIFEDTNEFNLVRPNENKINIGSRKLSMKEKEALRLPLEEIMNNRFTRDTNKESDDFLSSNEDGHSSRMTIELLEEKDHRENKAEEGEKNTSKRTFEQRNSFSHPKRNKFDSISSSYMHHHSFQQEPQEHLSTFDSKISKPCDDHIFSFKYESRKNSTGREDWRSIESSKKEDTLQFSKQSFSRQINPSFGTYSKDNIDRDSRDVPRRKEESKQSSNIFSKKNSSQYHLMQNRSTNYTESRDKESSLNQLSLQPNRGSKFSSKGFSIENSSLELKRRSKAIEEENPPSKKIVTFCVQLSRILAQEEKLETAKLGLAELPEFSITKIYNMIDCSKKGNFDFEDFRSFLSEIGVSTSDARSLIDLYSSFDVNQICYLGYDEVKAMVMPVSTTEYREYLSEKTDSNKELTPEYRNCLKNLFENLFKMRKIILEVKKNLKKLKVDLNDIFEEVDKSDLGFTTTSSLLELFDRVRLSEGISEEFCRFRPSAVELFLYRVNLSDKMGVINFKDFYIFFSL